MFMTVLVSNIFLHCHQLTWPHNIQHSLHDNGCIYYQMSTNPAKMFVCHNKSWGVCSCTVIRDKNEWLSTRVETNPLAPSIIRFIKIPWKRGRRRRTLGLLLSHLITGDVWSGRLTVDSWAWYQCEKSLETDWRSGRRRSLMRPWPRWRDGHTLSLTNYRSHSSQKIKPISLVAIWISLSPGASSSQR